jgi:hypothetical protein
MKTGTRQHLKSSKRFVGLVRAELCKVFLSAIDNHDSKKIYEIGRAIDALDRHTSEADRNRASILTIKKMLDKSGDKWTIRELAEVIDWHDMKPDDGFSQLREICKKLKFPLKRSR